MAAYEIPNLRFSAEAAEAIPRRRFLSINEDEQAICANATTRVVGASAVDTTKAGEVMEIYDGIVIVEAGAEITAGSPVASDADGKVKASAVDGAGAIGTALTGALADGFVTVKLNI